MAECTVLLGLEKDCLNNIGGVQRVIYGDDDAITSVTVDPVTGIVTTITNTEQFFELAFRKEMATYTETANVNFDNGTTTYTGVVQLMLKRREEAKSKVFRKAAEGQRQLAIFLKDGNGTWWYLKHMRYSADEGGSGQKMQDGSKQDVTFTGEYESLALSAAEAAVLDLLEVVP